MGGETPDPSPDRATGRAPLGGGGDTGADTPPVRPAAAAAAFDWRDPLGLEPLLSPEERQLRDAMRKFCRERLEPRVLRANRDEGTGPGTPPGTDTPRE